MPPVHLAPSGQPSFLHLLRMQPSGGCSCHHRETGLPFSQRRARELPRDHPGPQAAARSPWEQRPHRVYLFEVTLVLGKGKFHCVIVFLI